MTGEQQTETWRLDALAANIPNLLALDSVPVRFGERYGWIALPRELAVQIVADHNERNALEAANREAVEALRGLLVWVGGEHSVGAPKGHPIAVAREALDRIARKP